MSSLFSRITTMRKTTRSNLVTFGIVIAFYLVVQLLSGAGVLSNSFRGQLIPICAYVVMAVSLNLTVGFLGELSLGHAGFMSVGAFAGVLVWTVLGESLPAFICLPLAFLAGGVVAGLFGVVVGVPVLRLSGDYLAIVTLAFGEIIKTSSTLATLGMTQTACIFRFRTRCRWGWRPTAPS